MIERQRVGPNECRPCKQGEVFPEVENGGLSCPFLWSGKCTAGRNPTGNLDINYLGDPCFRLSEVGDLCIDDETVHYIF